jgi:hypothetical protein
MRGFLDEGGYTYPDTETTPGAAVRPGRGSELHWKRTLYPSAKGASRRRSRKRPPWWADEVEPIGS